MEEIRNTEDLLMLMITDLADVIAELADACRAEIDASGRPRDAFPIHLVVPTFVVLPEFKADWKTMIPPAVWRRIDRLMGRFAVLMDDEGAIQSSPFALSHERLWEFREAPCCGCCF